MSHFTRVRTTLTDESTIRQALVRMNYEVLAADDGVYGYQGRRVKAEFKVRPSGTRYEIGFVREAKAFTVIADWWGVRVVKREEFMRHLAVEYALVATMVALAAKGFELQQQTTESNGEVRLVLRRSVAV